MVNENFCPDKKIGAVFGPLFGPKFGHFRSKIRCSDIFFENAPQICLKLGQKLGTIALNHGMTVLCLGKFLFWPFWPFLVQKYIACGYIMFLGCFWPFSSKTSMIFFYFLLSKLSLLFKKGQWKFLFRQQNRGHFWTLFWSKNLAIFTRKSGFRTFSWNCTSDLSKTWSKTGDNCFESFNGSVVSWKILVLAVLAIFGSKIHCLWWHYMVLGRFWQFSSKLLMFFVNLAAAERPQHCALVETKTRMFVPATS